MFITYFLSIRFDASVKQNLFDRAALPTGEAAVNRSASPETAPATSLKIIRKPSSRR
ncbi:MAG: hypothetical protein LBK73_14215 [Treponema sp.]|nr:hypothetical protein [Treponema sp.]